MPKGSDELTNARKEEIVNACASLYEKKSFREITIRDIGGATSFTRTSIYNYFQTKEEIFLSLLQREYERWKKDLEGIIRDNEKLDVDEFASSLASSLEKRECMLRLLSMNIYDMETNSRMENLTSFKKTYADTIRVLSIALKKFFPSLSDEDVNDFIYAFFPFLFGVYPYTKVTAKQKTAMERAEFKYKKYSTYSLVYAFISRFLKAF